MKMLHNEFEYRKWMVKDYLHLGGEFPSFFEPDELERELLKQMPKEFPCLARLERGANNHGPDAVKFLYRAEILEWAKLLGIVN